AAEPERAAPTIERSELRRMVLDAVEDLGRFGLSPSTDAVGAVASLIVNASRLGHIVDAEPERAADGWIVERKRHGEWRRTSGSMMLPRDLAEREAEEWRHAGIADAVRIRPVYVGAAPPEGRER